jgi:hypothetical protein
MRPPFLLANDIIGSFVLKLESNDELLFLAKPPRRQEVKVLRLVFKTQS